jgi:hypothetical protein
MRPNVFAKPLSQANRSLLSIFCCFLIIIAMWLGVCLDNRSVALAEISAEPLEVRITKTFDGAIASQPAVMKNLKDKVKDDLNEKSDSAMGGFGSANPVEEKAKPSMGQTKHSFDSSAKQVESTGDAVDGRTEENVANIQGEATDSGHEAENAIEDVMSNIKNKVN